MSSAVGAADGCGSGSRVEAARVEDLPAVRRLLAGVDLPGAGLEEQVAHLFVIRAGERLAGVGGLEVHGACGLVRSVAVDPAHQRRGLGLALWRRIEERARELGLADLYLLTLTAEAFFARVGFSAVPRESAPEEIRQSEEFRSLCPESAVLMRRRVGDPARRSKV